MNTRILTFSGADLKLHTYCSSYSFLVELPSRESYYFSFWLQHVEILTKAPAADDMLALHQGVLAKLSC